ncbi:hypothetical protein MRB53_001917 [Persea americana]|uniref:Uncharacterized protein n=1 Tax=Persea americana TaxID=3435 RepID=A0ACC2MT66_PERAE|nr:hypothetical protein MRB53_001917 [Persea americana]
MGCLLRQVLVLFQNQTWRSSSCDHGTAAQAIPILRRRRRHAAARSPATFLHSVVGPSRKNSNCPLLRFASSSTVIAQNSGDSSGNRNSGFLLLLRFRHRSATGLFRSIQTETEMPLFCFSVAETSLRSLAHLDHGTRPRWEAARQCMAPTTAVFFSF